MSSPMPDLPEHYPMPFNKNWEGPCDVHVAEGWECWCGDGARCTVFIDALRVGFQELERTMNE